MESNVTTGVDNGENTEKSILSPVMKRKREELIDDLKNRIKEQHEQTTKARSNSIQD